MRSSGALGLLAAVAMVGGVPGCGTAQARRPNAGAARPQCSAHWGPPLAERRCGALHALRGGSIGRVGAREKGTRVRAARTRARAAHIPLLASARCRRPLLWAHSLRWRAPRAATMYWTIAIDRARRGQAHADNVTDDPLDVACRHPLLRVRTADT